MTEDVSAWPGVELLDLLHALSGTSCGRSGPDWHAGALRLIDILMDGLRQPASADR